ncbi:hypothetical protein BDV30DRAFT_228513 [Aspergillus minisclerotigenes]|uniref:BTB domain-containing protein n=1 Tax=Aspergillus minisclerotigenes TaxID=656917 RepID=A0A5N6IXW4_9EURO|nr:hypothetical protein BDV30DRAFT_228513 [Aspergillus minisclerotigenes]
MDYIIDPEGDMLLIVEECSGNLHLDLVQKESSAPAAFHLGPTPDVQTIDEPVLSPAQSQSKSQLPLDSASNVGNSGPPVAIAKTVMLKIRVSSKHLTLASSYFRQRLVPETDDHRPVEKDVVPACVEDVDALLIMLDIIHGQTRKVPRSITFKKLFMIAVLVEHYECVEAMEAFAEVWAEKLKGEVPAVYSEDLVKWIGIAWIFRLESLFQKTTRTAIRRCTGPISAMDVPIPLALIASPRLEILSICGSSRQDHGTRGNLLVNRWYWRGLGFGLRRNAYHMDFGMVWIFAINQYWSYWLVMSHSYVE